MAKKVKLTEKQIKMLKEKYEAEPTKVLRITEQQFERLFPDKKKLNEAVEEIPNITVFGENVIKLLKEITTNQSEARVDNFWTSMNANRMKLIVWFKEFDIIALVPNSDEDEYKVKKKGLVEKIRKLYDDFKIKFDKENNEIDWEKEEETIDEMSLGDDVEVIETTTAGGVGGSYVAPLGHQGPIKRDLAPHKELNEEDLDETTMSGAATGSYEQPKMWAKDKKNWRHAHDTMYPGGTIVETNSIKKKIVSEALQLKRGIINDIKKKLDNLKALIIVSDLEGRKASQETFRNKNALAKAGFIWSGDNNVWVIPEDKFEIAKSTLSALNKTEFLISKVEEVQEYVAQATEGKTTKKDLLLANLEQYLEDLANATDVKAMSAEITRYLTFFASFRQYSHYNRLLIYLQRPDATKVASYKKWQEAGRQVNQGAKSIGILCPKFKTVRDDENGEESEEKKLTGWITCPVFDVSDTTAVSEDGEIPASPEWHGGNEPSEVADELYTNLVAVAESMNIKVTQTDAKGGEKGYSAGDHINLSSDVEGAGRASTMVHEIAHELMHWREKSLYYVGDEARNDRKLCELHAESVSFVVLKHYDLPVAHHPTYLALWGANKEKIRTNMTLITDVAKFIIKQVEIMANKGESMEEGRAQQLVEEMFAALG